MNSDMRAEATALAINVAIPEVLRWTDTRRGQTFTLTTLNVRLLADGHLAAKAYGRPVSGGRGAYVSFAVPQNEFSWRVRRPRPQTRTAISGWVRRRGYAGPPAARMGR